MKIEKRRFAAVMAAATALGCGDSESKATRPALVHVEGDRIVDAEGAPLALEGIQLGPSSAPGEPVAGEDAAAYAQVAAMGMNLVRLYFDAATLEDDAAPGGYRTDALDWLDRSVALARESGLYVLLTMAVPPGGTTLDCGNDAFWTSLANQDRMVALWHMLAARYVDEPTIAGYALFDLPNPTQSLEQWQALADRTVQAIRAVDSGHALFVARALAIQCVFDKTASETFVRVNDDNVVYEFDRLQPWFYVAQVTAPAGNRNGAQLPEYGPYPDESRFVIDKSKSQWLYTPEDTRPDAEQLRLGPDETEWTEKSFYYTVTDPQFAFVAPMLQANNTAGKAYFDDIRIEEVTTTGARLIKEIDVESRDEWYFWQGNKEGNEIPGTGVVTVEKTAHRGQASLAISGTTSYANLGGEPVALVSVGRTYRVTSWVKGENIGSTGSARVRLDFLGYPEPLHAFNRATLEELFADFRAWGRAQGAPMFVNGFGTGRPTFESDRGGLVYVSDMIDILRGQQLGFAYYGYRDKDFGLYTNAHGAPDADTVNQPLLDLLTEKLR